MMKLFSLTKVLRLEHRPKLPHPTYMTLLDGGDEAWWLLGMTLREQRKAAVREFHAELEELDEGMRWVRLRPHMISKVFPRITRVAVGSIYGKQHDWWGEHARSQTKKLGPAMWRTQMIKGTFDQLLAELPSFKHLCIRGTQGTLLLP
jgi:hypothetical protein